MNIELIPVACDLGAPVHGTSHGPEALRVAGLAHRLSDETGSVGEACRVRWARPLAPDLSDDPVDALAALAARIAEATAGALDHGRFPLVLGGDHAIAVGTWSGIAAARRRRGALGLIWIDAHMDSHTPDTSETGNLHGMPLAALLGEGDERLTTIADAAPKLQPEFVCLVGVRSFEAGEAARLERLGVNIFGIDEVRRRGLAAVMADALAIAGAAPAGFGVTFDVDALDPEDAPGVTVPEANGLRAAEVRTALRQIGARPGLLALEVVEYNPLNDPGGQTAELVVDLVVSTVAAMIAKESDMSHAIAQERRFGARNYDPLPVVLTRGKGAVLWDEDGKRYIDMMSAYSAVSLGHAHPELVRVLAEQASHLAVTSRAYFTDRLPPLLERLCALTGMDRALPVNTGLEAVETALKASRKWGHKVKGIADGQAEIICCAGNFHGRSISIVAMSSEAQYKDGFGPFPGGYVKIPYGDAGALERAITPRTAAFLVEPIQGEAGIVVPPAGYLARCAEICRRHNVLFIVDEVQTGLGRTGRMFAWEHDGEAARPDGIILGKALGGGLLPVSAFCARDAVMAVFTPGDHGSTFGGNPLGAAVACATLDILQRDRLAERAADLGDRLLASLRAIDSPLVREVRGKGLLIGMDLDPRRASAKRLAEELLAEGVLTKDTHGTVLRFAPPLVIREEELAQAAETIRRVLSRRHNHLPAAA